MKQSSAARHSVDAIDHGIQPSSVHPVARPHRPWAVLNHGIHGRRSTTSTALDGSTASLPSVRSTAASTAAPRPWHFTMATMATTYFSPWMSSLSCIVSMCGIVSVPGCQHIMTARPLSSSNAGSNSPSPPQGWPRPGSHNRRRRHAHDDITRAVADSCTACASGMDRIRDLASAAGDTVRGPPATARGWG